MPITVVCSAPVRYDPGEEKYIACGRKLKVADKLAGRRVKCPDCGNAVEIPAAESPPPSSHDALSNLAEDDDWLTLQPDDALLAPQKASSKKSSEKKTHSPESPSDASKQTPSTSKAAVKTSAAANEQKEAVLLPDAGSASRTSPFDARNAAPGVVKPCPNCGVAMPLHGALCESCGYHNKLDRHFGKLGDTEPELLITGFRRWLGKRLTSGESAGAMISMSPLILAAFVFVVSGLAYLVFDYVGLAIALAPWAVFFVGGGLRFWPLAPWELVLVWGRKFGWRNWTPALPKVAMLDLRKGEITDDDLMQRNDLAEYGAIDLEGKPISDAALAHLAAFRNLGFIILKGTNVTEDGLFQTEQKMPNSWFWY